LFCGVLGSFGMRTNKGNKVYLSIFPELVSEFDFEKKKPLKPNDFTHGSSKKIWWQCQVSKNHSWAAAVKERTRLDGKASGCPYCAGKRVCADNNLGVLHPELVAEWHPSKNHPETPEDVTKSSNKKVWWICRNGHEWKREISARSAGRDCPYCSNQKVSKTNNLETIAPHLISEWDFEKNKKEPKDYVAGSSKKVWWKCLRGHSWQAGINSRVAQGTRCPKCAPQSSRSELRIYSELSVIFKNIEHRHKVEKDEVDIFLPDIKLGIEYDGSYFHKDKQSIDLEKNARLKHLGINLVRVRNYPLTKLSSKDLIIKKEPLEKSDMNKIMSIFVELEISKNQRNLIKEYKSKKTFVAEQLFREKLSDISNPLPGLSLVETHPSLAQEWNFVKNHPLLPEQFSGNTHQKIWWKCFKGHEWQSKIYSRTQRKGKGGCPYCSGRRVSKEINLQASFPKIAAEWHPSKNGDLTPDKVTTRNGKKVWWQCANGHEWEYRVSDRTRLSTSENCPYCSGARASKANNLSIKNPDLLQLWDYEKNGDMAPSDVVPGSHKKVWWKCDKGHSYKKEIRLLAISGQIRCPICKTL